MEDAFTRRPPARRSRSPPPGFGPLPSATAAMHTDPFSFEVPVHRLAPGLDTFYGGGGAVHAVEEHTNPFSFGLDLSLSLAPPGSSSAPFSGGYAEQRADPFTLDPWSDPYSGGGGAHPVHSNPFGFGLDLARLPHAGGFGPFGGGFPPAPVYGNPFNADGPALASMGVPAPWDLNEDGHVQPAGEEHPSPRLIPAPATPVCDSGKPGSSTPTRPQLCTPYDDDIEATLRAQEDDATVRPSPGYLATTQGGRMSPEARASLVRWMNRITRRYALAAGTLHRAVSYADRFLSAQPLADVGTDRLHLLGAAAVYAAAKYEDEGTVARMHARELASYGGFASSQEVVDMERVLLAALGFRLGAPTAFTFVDHFTRHLSQGEEDQELLFRAHDFADVSLLDYGCLELKPSAVAAAAIFLARLTLKPSCEQMNRWNRELMALTGYKPKDLKCAVDAIRSLIPDGHGNGFDDVVVSPAFYEDPSEERR